MDFQQRPTFQGADQLSIPGDIGRTFEDLDDFIASTVAGTMNWANSVSGTGAAANLNTTLVGPTAPGVVELLTGTVATNRAGLNLNPAAIAAGGGQIIFEARVQIQALSSSADTFKIYVGLLDTANVAGDAVDGIYFTYTHGEVSGAWKGNTASNSVRSATTAVTPVVAAGQWYRLRAVVNAAGNNVDFYVNGTLLGSLTANIPNSNARVTGPGFKIEKSVGTTSRALYIDYFYLRLDFTARR